jgi:hypothetical protein
LLLILSICDCIPEKSGKIAEKLIVSVGLYCSGGSKGSKGSKGLAGSVC